MRWLTESDHQVFARGVVDSRYLVFDGSVALAALSLAWLTLKNRRLSG